MSRYWDCNFLIKSDQHVEIRDLLIEYPDDIDMINTLVFYYEIFRYNAIKVMETLLNDFNLGITNNLYTALVNNVSKIKINMIELLLQYGLDLNKKIENKSIFQHLIYGASQNERIDLFKFLIDINIDIDYNTAFTIACNAGNYEIVQYLIDINVIDINQIDNQLFRAIVGKSIMLIDILMKAGANPCNMDKLMPITSNHPWHNTIDMLINNGLDPITMIKMIS